MTDIFAAETEQHLLDAVRWATAEEQALGVAGGGSKAAFGRPADVSRRLDVKAMSGVVKYEPEELVLSVRAATPLAQIETLMGERRQWLAFEPPDLGPLLGAGGGDDSDKRAGTLGGVLACNLAGPRRVQVGAARDHLLGFQGVSGRGEVFKSGGRVVKNVTGFDLSKLICGSYGTLAVMTEVTVRALPAAEETRTVLVLGLADDQGVAAMTRALQGPFDISGAAHLPAAVAARSGVAAVAGAGGAVTALRIEGPESSVAARARAARDVLAGFGELAELDAGDSAVLWREVRDVQAFVGDDQGAEKPVWRVSVPPAAGARVAGAILGAVAGEVLYDWSGGLLWLALEPAADAHEALVRGALGADGGHATLIRAPVEARARVSVFQPQPAALAAVTRRVKEGFDPKRVLNPGRMYEGL